MGAKHDFECLQEQDKQYLIEKIVYQGILTSRELERINKVIQ
jgi:hypothetical protein